MFAFDAHLDLSMNAMEWNRDLRMPVQAIRQSEEGLTDKPDRARGTVAFPQLREGNIGLVVATQIGRYVSPDSKLSGCSRTGMGTNTGPAAMVPCHGRSR